jgi:hypothetical protein
MPSWILPPMIIWLNGAFRAGKTALAEELHRRLPAAVVFNPEDVGLMLWKWLEPNDDFQDLPSWRELVVATAVFAAQAPREHAYHADVTDPGDVPDRDPWWFSRRG